MGIPEMSLWFTVLKRGVETVSEDVPDVRTVHLLAANSNARLGNSDRHAPRRPVSINKSPFL